MTCSGIDARASRKVGRDIITQIASWRGVGHLLLGMHLGPDSCVMSLLLLSYHGQGIMRLKQILSRSSSTPLVTATGCPHLCQAIPQAL